MRFGLPILPPMFQIRLPQVCECSVCANAVYVQPHACACTCTSGACVCAFTPVCPAVFPCKSASFFLFLQSRVIPPCIFFNLTNPSPGSFYRCLLLPFYPTSCLFLTPTIPLLLFYPLLHVCFEVTTW